MQGLFDKPGETINRIYQRWGIGIFALPVLLVIALVGLAMTPGSASNVPMQTPIHSGCLSLRAKIDEPHTSQNHFSPPSSGFQHLRTSSPATMRNDSTAA